MESLLVSAEGFFLQIQCPSSFTTLSKRPLHRLKFTRSHGYNRSSVEISSPLLKPKPNFPTQIPHQHNKEPSEWQTRQKVAYLESMGVDSYSALAANSAISTTNLESIQTVVNFLVGMGIPQEDLGRLFVKCPEVLTASVRRQLRPVFTFLAREVKIPHRHLRQVIYRRPRLLACSVKDQLRPNLYFLQRLGFTDVGKISFLLTCSVELKLLPRLEYVQSLGIAYNDAVSMFLRFPALFNYSLDENVKPKLEYLVKEMGRSVYELKPFPQYFAYSLEKKIKPRHRFLVENGVRRISLPAMLRGNDDVFFQKFKDLNIGVDSNVNELELEGLYSYGL